MKNKHGTKKSNVIALIPSGAQSLLDKFTQSHELSDFLSLIEIIATTAIECPQVWETWSRLNSSVEASQPVDTVLKTIAHLSWSQVKPTQKSIFNSNTSVNSNAAQGNHSSVSAEDVVNAFDKELEYMTARHMDIDDPYRFFPAAWPLTKILEREFGEDDPGKTISKYLCAFYSAPISSSGSGVLIEVRQLSLPAFLKDSLLPWAFAYERGNLLNQKTDEAAHRIGQLAEIENSLPWLFDLLEGKIKLSDPSTFLHGFTVRGFAQILPNLPQSLFERLASSIGLDSYGFAEGAIEQGCSELFDILLSLPLDKPFHSLDEFEAQVPVNSFLRHAAEHIYSINSLPYLPIRFLPRITDFIVEEGYELDDSECPEALNSERLRELCVLVIERITDIRRLCYDGKSPLNYVEAGNLGVWLELLCEWYSLEINHDLTYLLSVGEDGLGFGDAAFGEIISEEMDLRRARLRTQNYFRVIERLQEEGWYEFANACLAFYLFSQPIYSKDRQLHADWPRLGKAIKAAVGLPGWHFVEKSLDCACSLIREGDQNSLDALCLAGWQSQGGHRRGSILSSDTISSHVLDHAQAELALKKYLGEAWIKLSPRGKRQLVDADAEWSALHHQLGKGRSDWGGLATAYVKVIEGELLFCMESIFSSPVYEAYCLAKNRKLERHITLGPMLHLLKDFGNLDQSLRQEIVDTGIRIQSDASLLRNLLWLMNVIRNPGSHPAGISAEKFVALRTLLFQEEVLKRFIELL